MDEVGRLGLGVHKVEYVENSEVSSMYNKVTEGDSISPRDNIYVITFFIRRTPNEGSSSTCKQPYRPLITHEHRVVNSTVTTENEFLQGVDSNRCRGGYGPTSQN